MQPSLAQLQLMMSLMQLSPFTASFQPFAPAWPNWSAPWPLQSQRTWQNPWSSLLPNEILPENLVNNPVLEALARISLEQTAEYIQNMQACLGEGFTHRPTPSKIIWQRGNATLHDYAPHARNKTVVLCIPSLINKSYILDLAPDASLIRFLKDQGLRPLMLDWGEPSEAEENFDCADYIQAYALSALAHVREHHDGPIVLLGYCMGGVFALAMAQLAAISVDGLILLATPWDFASADTPVVLVNPASQATMRQLFQAHDTVPPWVIQSLFFWMNPFASLQKMQKFSGLSDDEKRRFAAIEHWANDAISITGNIAEECFVGWPQENLLATHRFHVGRTWIDPERIKCEALIITALRDKIVPMGCARPLAKALRRATHIAPDTGHVGMVAGTRAPDITWQPMLHWLQQRF